MTCAVVLAEPAAHFVQDQPNARCRSLWQKGALLEKCWKEKTFLGP